MRRDEAEEPNAKIPRAGGLFALLAAFLAWRAALAGTEPIEISFITYILREASKSWQGPRMSANGLANKLCRIKSQPRQGLVQIGIVYL